MASDGDYQKRGPRLFGVDLTQLYTNLSHEDRPVKAFLGEETRANKEGHNDMPELKGSASKSSAKRCKGRVFPCRYCPKKFYDSKALGGHQNAHRIEQKASKTNPFLNRLPTDSFQYPAVVGQQPTHGLLKTNPLQNSLPTDTFQYPVVVGQQPTHPLFASSRRLPHNFDLQRADVSNNQPHFEEFAQNFHVNLASSSLSSVKVVRNDMELASRSLPSVKRVRTEDRAREEDPEQHNTTPGRMVTLNTEDVGLDLSLHL